MFRGTAHECDLIYGAAREGLRSRAEPARAGTSPPPGCAASRSAPGARLGPVRPALCPFYS